MQRLRELLLQGSSSLMSSYSNDRDVASGNNATGVKSSRPSCFSANNEIGWYNSPDEASHNLEVVSNKFSSSISSSSPNRNLEVAVRLTRAQLNSICKKIPIVVLERLPDCVIPDSSSTEGITTKTKHSSRAADKDDHKIRDVMDEHAYIRKAPPRLRCISPARLFPQADEGGQNVQTDFISRETKKRLFSELGLFCGGSQTVPNLMSASKAAKRQKFSHKP